MKQAYPIVITKDKDLFAVYVPDLNINTQGSDIPEAMEMARDAIGMCGCYLQDEKRKVTAPSPIKKVKARPDDTVTLVDVDFDEYRRRHDARTVRKNVSLPSWLNEEAERTGINFSALLQKALKKELRV